MTFINRVRVTGVIMLTLGTAWISTKIKETREFFNGLLDVQVIEQLEPYSSIEELLPDEESCNDSIGLSNLPVQNVEPLSARMWHYLKFSYAKRLLKLSQSETYVVRSKAVKHLSKIKNLEDWQFSILSQEIGSTTAVALARNYNVDSRWFHDMPIKYTDCNTDSLQKKMKEFLMMLSVRSQHKCLSYFISKVFFDGHDSKFSDKSLEPSELVRHIKTHHEILPLCIESILHHSSIIYYAKDILTLNGLSLLYQLYLQFQDKDEICKHLAQILFNISVYPNSLEEFNKSGWIKVLWKWSNSSDLSLSTTAACTLANLDMDEKYSGKYYRQLYLLHPLKGVETESDVDIVLVHGLLGGVFHTWRQRDRKNVESLESRDYINHEIDESVGNALISKELHNIEKDFEFVLYDIPCMDNTMNNSKAVFTCDRKHGSVKHSVNGNENYTYCWPKDWLIKDCEDVNIRLLGINFSTTLSMWASICPEEQHKSNLVERSSELMSKLVQAGVGNRPIIWIAHSMGGLLVKHMLVKAKESNAKHYRNLVDNTKGIVFFSTPHRGSPLAALSPPTSLLLWPTAELVELKHNSPLLLEIHDKFVKLVDDSSVMRIVSFVETKTTLVKPLRMNLHFVQESSASMEHGESYLIPLDHLNICKPVNRQSFLYQKIVQLVKDVAREQGISDGT